MEQKLLVGGIISLTTVDYPGHLAAVIFMQGCTWRCKYCHNQHLQSILPKESLPWEDILNLLSSRKGLLEAVVFSGGEPLLQDALADAIADVKKLGFKVGLHTAGAFPDKLAKIVSSLDWVGFDVKHSFKDYDKIVSVPNQGDLARKSLEILIASNVDFEVRMTLHESIETSSIVEVLKEISSMGVKQVVLQKCRDKNEKVVEHPIFSDKLLLEDLSKYFDSLSVRG
ncbi:MAG: anaerobic ribonucleoside-triphosphate reductase activating protein [Alphaproteobacteria bacterium]|nr:anaerobic ribonucleoside-triphosphate reductase activating protein [Alphaproteobacteria bacterium]